MESIEVFNASYARVSYVPQYKTIMVVWNGIHTIDEYRRALTAALDFQKSSQLPVLNYLSDIRKQGIVNPESRKWFENFVIPKAIEVGIKNVAVVYDESIFKKYYINMILQISSAYPVRFKLVTSTDDAIEWFKSINK